MGRLITPIKKPVTHPALLAAQTSSHPLARCKPRGDRIVVKRDGMKDSTPGGILLPDSAINKHQPTGVVICVGPGKRGRDGKYIAIDLEPGQRIIMSTYAGLEIRGELGAQDDQDYVIMREEDVQAVLAEE